MMYPLHSFLGVYLSLLPDTLCAWKVHDNHPDDTDEYLNIC